jgi:hypothetical protein
MCLGCDHVNAPVAQRLAEANAPLTTPEKQAVLKAILDVVKDSPIEIGPRAVRSFMFRYQLARLILAALVEPNWSPAELATAIASVQFLDIAPSTNLRISEMAKQVA